jgi:hypothetical protein
MFLFLPEPRKKDKRRGEVMKFWRVFLVVSFLILPFAVASEGTAADYGTLNFNFNFDPANYPTVSTDFTVGSGTLSTTGSGLAVSSYDFAGSEYIPSTTTYLAFTSGAWTALHNWGSGGSSTLIESGVTLATGTTTGTTFTQATIPGYGITYQITLTGLNMALSTAGNNLLSLNSGNAYNWNGSVTLNFVLNNAHTSAQVYSASGQGTVNGSPVPIPPTLLLMVAGLVGLGAVRKRIK